MQPPSQPPITQLSQDDNLPLSATALGTYTGPWHPGGCRDAHLSLNGIKISEPRPAANAQQSALQALLQPPINSPPRRCRAEDKPSQQKPARLHTTVAAAASAAAEAVAAARTAAKEPLRAAAAAATAQQRRKLMRLCMPAGLAARQHASDTSEFLVDEQRRGLRPAFDMGQKGVRARRRRDARNLGGHWEAHSRADGRDGVPVSKPRCFAGTNAVYPAY